MEQKIQKKIITRLEAEGWYVVKLSKTNKNGIPDLLAIKKEQTMFIEVKQPNGKLSEIQKFRIDELRKQGITVKIWCDYECDFV
jgi:Holliday junction resolvase